MLKDFLLYSQSVNILENTQQKSLWALSNGDHVSCGRGGGVSVHTGNPEK